MMQGTRKLEHLVSTPSTPGCEFTTPGGSQQHNIGATHMSGNPREFDIADHYNCNQAELVHIKKRLEWIVKKNLSLPNDVKVKVDISFAWSKLSRSERKDKYSTSETVEVIREQRQFDRKLRNKNKRRTRAEKLNTRRQLRIAELASKASDSKQKMEDRKREQQLRAKERKAKTTIKVLTRLASKRVAELPNWRLRLGEGQDMQTAAKILSIPFKSYVRTEADKMKAAEFKARQACNQAAHANKLRQMERQKQAEAKAADCRRREYYEMVMASSLGEQFGRVSYEQFKKDNIHRTADGWTKRYDEAVAFIRKRDQAEARSRSDAYSYM